MIAVVPVRDGRLPAGSDVVVDAAGGRVLLVGAGTTDASLTVRAAVTELSTCEAGPFAPWAWVEGLAGVLAAEHAVVLPGSPDGRDLAGRLAARLGRHCFAWCTEVHHDRVVTTRLGGVQSVVTPVTAPFVATLVPHARPVRPAASVTPVAVAVALGTSGARDATVLGVDEADPAEVDLAEADRIVAGGLGLGGPAEFEVLARVATALGASLGATRPVADAGIVGPERQIGTTGVTVDPSLYLAFGISGAVQHTAGLGHPARVIAVNTEAACPMMAMADLAVVADAPATARALAALLEAGER